MTGKDTALMVAHRIAQIPVAVIEKLEDGLAILTGFVQEHEAYGGKSSTTRLCALAFMVVAVSLGRDAGKIALAHWADPNAQGMVKALVMMATMFVSSGCVALLLKSKPPAASSDDKGANG